MNDFELFVFEETMVLCLCGHNRLSHEPQLSLRMHLGCQTPGCGCQWFEHDNGPTP